MNVGGDGFTIRNNTVEGNSTFGVAILFNPLFSLDPRIEPNPDNNEVRGNVAINNGFRPPPHDSGSRPLLRWQRTWQLL